MKKQKLIPIVIAVILAIVAIILFINLMNKKNEVYSKLIVNYNNETKEYDNLVEVPVISVGSGKFVLGSIEPQRIILASNSSVIVNNETKDEIDIAGGKEQKICFNTNDCFSVTYSR